MAASFREQLVDLRQSLSPYTGRGAGAFHPVLIRPALAWSMVPRPRERRPQCAGRRDDAARRKERTDRVLAGAGPPALGLVEGSESDANLPKGLRRNGLHGLTANGGKKVEDFCRLVKQDRGLYGIWTVTMPPECAAELDQIEGGIRLFGDALRRRFSEALARACRRESKFCRRPIDADWAYVIEPQQSGRPHWHFVFRCKSRRGRGWLLGKGRLDRLIRNCMRSTTGRNHRYKAAGNVQSLKRDPGSYLSSYLKKTASVEAAETLLANGYGENLIPGQWWGMSRSALALVERHRFELPSVLVGWLSKSWPDLARLGLLKARIWQPESHGAPSMICGGWRSIEQAVACIRLLAENVEAATPTGLDFGRT